jgi:hypothetical protein
MVAAAPQREGPRRVEQGKYLYVPAGDQRLPVTAG